MAKRRYVKADDPSVFAYFTDASIEKYDPVRAGWVPESTRAHPKPVDVVNFMEKKDPVKCDPIEVKTEKFVDVTTTPTRELTEIFKTLTEDNLLEIIKTDERTTAKKLAEKEIKSREQ